LNALTILFVGDTTPYLTTAARRDAFVSLGQRVETVDQRHFVGSPSRWMTRATFWSLLTPAVFAFNRALLDAAERVRPDLAWIEKGTFVFPRTLRALRRRGIPLVYHNTDDTKKPTAKERVHWRFLLRTLDEYDMYVTSNLHNVDEFRRAGFPNVHHMELCANEAVQVPTPPDEALRARLGGPVGFIGHWEPATERQLLHLVQSGIPLVIYGPHWEQAKSRDELAVAVRGRGVYGDEYAQAIVSFDINIGIVSTVNRNHTASRTFQIPALGAFLLHQRNEVVTSYFREGEEAAFFSSDDELLEKCRYYLDHPDERRAIAAAGRRRCLESGYFETDRVRDILPALEALVRQHRQGRRP
jgi:spore maturation protein CgeB